MTIFDTVGIVKGAHYVRFIYMMITCEYSFILFYLLQGQGMGNANLDQVRQADIIYYVLRAFEDDDLTHYYETVDPSADLLVIEQELMLKVTLCCNMPFKRKSLLKLNSRINKQFILLHSNKTFHSSLGSSIS